jgi:D-alanyl-D-alanine carboxypeptidase
MPNMKKHLSLFIIGAFLVPQFVFGASIDRDFRTLLSNYPEFPVSKQSACVSDKNGKSLFGYNDTLGIVPASVSKVYVTDFVISNMDPQYQFKTNFIINGSTLYINGDGDPFFIPGHLEKVLTKITLENKNIKINKIIFSNFYLNWSDSVSGTQIQMQLFLKKKSQIFTPSVAVIHSPVISRVPGKKYVFTSNTLLSSLKEMNIYSTNSAADIFFARLGGKVAFHDYMKKTYGAGPETISFKTGSGLEGNMTTCRLTLSVLKHLNDSLTAKGLTLLHVLPIPVVDGGSMKNRMKNIIDPKVLVVKPGFVYYHDTLAGVLNTSKGNVYFAVFTDYYSRADGPRARLFIDTFVEKLIKEYRAQPFAYLTKPLIQKVGLTVERVN